ncbi:MAG TPA: VWA domain-containing protein [Spirochaetales bacterium]|nr:VWA domain-containing protein [Spirochaetales bacterium]
MIVFNNPEFGVIVLLVVAVQVAMFLKYGKRYRISFEIYNGKKFKNPPIYINAIYCIGCVLMVLGWLLIGISALDPVKFVSNAKKINTNNMILYILDASPSMSASDISPTRFTKAVTLIEQSAKSSNALHALIAFGKDALLVCPPTPQTDIFLERLHAIQPGICGDGTNILAALKSALVQITTTNIHESAIVLLSDGEDYESISQFSALFDTFAIQSAVYFAAIGKGGDIPVLYTDPFTKEETTGLYRSQFNEEKLKSALESTSITFFVNPEFLDISLSQGSETHKIIDASMEIKINLLPFAVGMLLVGWFMVFGIIGGKI